MKNKLFAQICKAVIANAILSTPFFTWRFLIGPINEHFSIFVSFIRCFDATIMLLCFMEIIIFRILNLFVHKHLNIGNEELMSRFLDIFNTCFTFVTHISRWMLGKQNWYWWLLLTYFIVISNRLSNSRYSLLPHIRITREYRNWAFKW